MGKIIDLTGQRFGRLEVIERHPGGGHKQHVMWRCICDCGKQTTVNGYSLRSGATTSCGCYGREQASETNKKHGGSRRERLYRVWCSMRNRCENPYDKNYEYYGGRGIKVCAEWADYAAFREWALSNGYNPDAPHGQCTLDRIDVNRGYCPDNCRWVDMKAQANNRRPRKTGYKRTTRKKEG